MKQSKRFLFPALLMFFSFMAFGCQSESSTEVSPTDPPMEEKPDEAELSDPQPVDISAISNTIWQWTELVENNPAAQSVVADPENYRLTFWDDGTFNFKADCNSGGGSYTVEGSQIEFGPMMSTMAMCPPESLHDQFLALLGEIDTFGMSGDTLAFSLKADAGEMRLKNSGPAEKLETETETPAPEEKNIFVGPEKVECVGVGPQECYQIKENPNDEWQLFYDQIEGFEWEPGYTYELRVAIHQVENPPADASSLRYELIEVVNQVETPVAPEQPASYIAIEQPSEGAVIDTKQSILVSGTGAGLFEGNVVVQIIDASGNEIALQPTIIQSPEAGIGGEGSWEVELKISIEAATPGKIVAFSPSPKDGEDWLARDEVNVSLNPTMLPNVELENTSWLLRAFAQQEELNTLLTVYPITIRFNPKEGVINGIAGCNNYFTGYAENNGQLTIHAPIGTTRMMCPEPQMVLENTYLAALENIGSYEMTCNAMEIMDTEGSPLLVFQVDPFSVSESFSREELANTSYLNEFATDGVVQLANGMYREPAAEGSATELVVMLTNHAVFGDVTGDEAEDAVVVLVSQPGGSGSFYDLAVVRKQGEAITNMARIQLGDRIQIKSMYIENGEIVVDMLTQGSDDPMCCPTLYVSNHYKLENGELVLTRSETIE